VQRFTARVIPKVAQVDVNELSNLSVVKSLEVSGYLAEVRKTVEATNGRLRVCERQELRFFAEAVLQTRQCKIFIPSLIAEFYSLRWNETRALSG
jgi:hypothetical protein